MSKEKNIQELEKRLASLEERIEENRTVKLRLEAYRFLKDYDLHYSTVRSAISTLLLTLTVALGQVALQYPKVFPFYFALILIMFLFACTLVITLYFQSLTWSCRKLQEAIELQIYGQNMPRNSLPWSSLCSAQAERILASPMRVRQNIEEIQRRSKIHIALWRDLPLRFTWIGIVIYLCLFIYFGKY